MPIYPDLGLRTGQILLPSSFVDLHKWAVIACDQFTSEPEYWKAVEATVGDAPSTYRLTLPEVFLGTPEEECRVMSTREAMRAYLKQGIFTPFEGMVLVRRSVDGKTRHGLVLALDLEKYDYSKGSQTLIRATEGTILDRLPPRIRIREGAPLELPHILVLIDDPQRTVIEPLVEQFDRLPVLYDTELMFDSGHLSGRAVSEPALESRVIAALSKLADPRAFRERYQVGEEKGVLLFAMGDGNHSFATAKAIWEKVKAEVGPDHPARYALVEIENVHDEGLEFEPIHRVLFNVPADPFPTLRDAFAPGFEARPCAGAEEMIECVNRHSGGGQAFGVVTPAGYWLAVVSHPTSNLAVGTLQNWLDGWIKQVGAKIDYVHGDDVVCRLGAQPGNLGFYLPGMAKGDLFRTVILDGALPRKTFSMGEAREKRFYFEARRITHP